MSQKRRGKKYTSNELMNIKNKTEIGKDAVAVKKPTKQMVPRCTAIQAETINYV
jgi:hypothetical protein